MSANRTSFALAGISAENTRFIMLMSAYMVANFILMSHGYPPVIIYRAVFRWWRNHMLAVKRSCRLGLMRAIPEDNWPMIT